MIGLIMKAGFSGKRLKLLRMQHGLTQEEAARQWDVFQQEVSRWETEKQNPDARRLAQICKFFNVSPAYLLNMSDMKTGAGVDIDSETASEILEAIRNNDLNAYIQLFYRATGITS